MNDVATEAQIWNSIDKFAFGNYKKCTNIYIKGRLRIWGQSVEDGFTVNVFECQGDSADIFPSNKRILLQVSARFDCYHCMCLDSVST